MQQTIEKNEEKNLIISDTRMGISDVKAQVDAINTLLKQVMRKDVHYGLIPGCGKKYTLLKPGAEKIAMTFRIAIDCEVEDLSNEEEARYRVKAMAIHIPSKSPMGTSHGECSSAEEKYKWRTAVCDEEYEHYPENKKRIKFKKGYDGKPHTQAKQVREEKADKANTVLKMAEKRALVAIILKCTSASDIFTQDMEDGVRSTQGKPSVSTPQPKETYACRDCGLVIDKKVHDFSLNSTFYKRPLCRECQDKARTKR